MDKILPSLSIVICSTRPLQTQALLASLDFQLQGSDEVIVIFDIFLDSTFRTLFLAKKHSLVRLYINKVNKGLSFCRNFGMQRAKNQYVIFFDDDVVVPQNILALYRKHFAEGCAALGGPLKLPCFYKRLPPWLPEGYSSLLGIHTTQQRIWGANFGFNVQLAKFKKICFKEILGRSLNGLESGDETDFLQRFCPLAGQSKFLEELSVFHCIDPHRFHITYLLKRSYWQGRSEVRKSTIVEGIKKELRRSQKISSPLTWMGFFQRIVGGILLVSCGAGIISEFYFTISNRLSSSYFKLVHPLLITLFFPSTRGLT